MYIVSVSSLLACLLSFFNAYNTKYIFTIEHVKEQRRRRTEKEQRKNEEEEERTKKKKERIVGFSSSLSSFSLSTIYNMKQKKTASKNELQDRTIERSNDRTIERTIEPSFKKIGEVHD